MIYSQRRSGAALTRENTVPAGKRWQVPLVLRRGLLQGGLRYRLNVTATTQHGAASAFVDVDINSPPMGGTLSVQPLVGVAGDTSFVFNAAGWRDEEGDAPLRYRFGVRPGTSSQTVWLTHLVSEPRLETVLPQGDTSSNQLTVISEVHDSLGAVATHQRSITVSPTANDIVPHLSQALVTGPASLAAIVVARSYSSSCWCKRCTVETGIIR